MNADERRRSWALLQQLMSDHRRVLAGAIVGGLLWQMAGLVVPLILGWMCTLTDAALRLDDEGQATFPPGEVHGAQAKPGDTD